MKSPANDIDHLSLTAHSPDELAGRLQQLGFNATPEGIEPRCICFPPSTDEIPNYIEILEGEPGAALALNVGEIEGDAEVREHVWESEDGYDVEGKLLVGKTEGSLPWFPVRHETPDTFMEPEWIIHPNGALGLIAIHVVAQDPAELAKTLGESWKAMTEEIIDGCVLVKTGSVELLLWSGSAWQNEYKAIEAMAPDVLPAVAGITVAVERARPLQALLAANNINFALGENNRVIVPPDQTGGLAIEFMPQN
jgi:hypothetical protein